MFFGGGYESNKIKIQLKLAVSRIQILKNKKANIVRDEKRGVAELLKNKNEESARIRVETIIRDENLIECYQIIEVLCELLHARLNLINHSTEMPLEMKESIFTLVYAAQRVQIPELEQIKNQLKYKYGKNIENDANCQCGTHVNPKIVQKLSYLTPDPAIVFQALSDIAEKFNVDWCSNYAPPFLMQPQSPQIIHHQQQPIIIQQQPLPLPQPHIIQQQPQMPSFPIMSPPQQPTFSQIQHQQQVHQQYQQQQQNQQNQPPQFPSAPPQFYNNNNNNNQPPQFPNIPSNNNFNNKNYDDNNNNYNGNNNNNNYNGNNNNYNGNNSNNNNGNMPPPYQPSNNQDTGSFDFDELTARFTALKKSNDF